jgi:hypothetical protein
MYPDTLTLNTNDQHVGAILEELDAGNRYARLSSLGV